MNNQEPIHAVSTQEKARVHADLRESRVHPQQFGVSPTLKLRSPNSSTHYTH